MGISAAGQGSASLSPEDCRGEGGSDAKARTTHVNFREGRGEIGAHGTRSSPTSAGFTHREHRWVLMWLTLRSPVPAN